MMRRPSLDPGTAQDSLTLAAMMMVVFLATLFPLVLGVVVGLLETSFPAGIAVFGLGICVLYTPLLITVLVVRRMRRH
jgi:hypothetical protein